MIKKEIRLAIRRKDWETAQKLQDLQNSQMDEKLKAAQLKKSVLDEQLLEAQIIKTLAEARKIDRDKVGGLMGIISSLVAVIISAATFIKSFFK